MKGAARNGAGPLADQLLGPAQHFLRGAPGKGQQKDRARRNAAFDEPGHAIDERASLARARARDHQQRAVAMNHRLELGGIQRLGVLDPETALIDRMRAVPQENYLVRHVGPGLYHDAA